MSIEQSGGRGLRFHVLGFPVSIDISFVIVLAILGAVTGFTVERLLIWIALGAVSVLAHELGHALVARTTGAKPVIDLYGFGGVTTYLPPGPLSRARQLLISIAGPAVGIVVGLLLLFAVPHDAVAPGSLAAYAISAAIFVNLGWGVLNLLPILPLDGGAVLTELLPGEPGVRRRRAAAVSVVVAGVVAVAAYFAGYLFGTLFAAWLAFDNLRLLRAPARPAVPVHTVSPASVGIGPVDRTALDLLDDGQTARAQQLLESSAQGDADMAVRGLALVLSGHPRTGRHLLETAVAEAPLAPVRVQAYARLLLFDRSWSRLAALLEGPAGVLVDRRVAQWAREGARADGALGDSDRIDVLLRGSPEEV